MTVAEKIFKVLESLNYCNRRCNHYGQAVLNPATLH